MNANRVLRVPMIELVMAVLILLAVGGLSILVAVAWPLIHVPPVQSPIQADPLEIVNVFHSALNSDNVDAMLALFAQDATIIDGGSTIQGKEQIRNWVLHSQRMVGLRLKLIHSQVTGGKILWQDIAHNGPEVEHRIYLLRWMAIVQKGKIQSLTVSLLPMPDGK